MTRSPNRELAAVTMVGESDEEVFANLDKLVLNEDEASVLHGARKETRTEARATQRSTTHRSPYDGRRNFRFRTQVEGKMGAR